MVILPGSSASGLSFPVDPAADSPAFTAGAEVWSVAVGVGAVFGGAAFSCLVAEGAEGKSDALCAAPLPRQITRKTGIFLSFQSRRSEISYIPIRCGGFCP